MKTLILAGLILAGSVHGHDGNAGYSRWPQANPVCANGSMDGFMAARIRAGAFEHALSDQDATAMLGLYHGYETVSVVRLLSASGSKDGTLALGDARGCFMEEMTRRLTWISHVLDRVIVHPTTS